MRVLIALCFLGLAFADLNEEWELFKKVNEKNYNVREEVTRRLTWEQNVRYIQKHNLEADLGLHTYWLGMNKYGDLTGDEFKRMMTGLKVDLSTKSEGIEFLAPNNIKLPDSVDWRKKGYVTGVKDQGACGSCWAFSATGSLEGQHFKKTGKLVSLSEQNLVDCSTAEGNHGCGGGWMDWAFQYIKVNHGIDTEKSYPYQARDMPCRFKKSNVGATDTGFVDIKAMDENALQQAVATVGPVSVAIDASHPSFHFYKHGVYNEPQCSQTALDHGVLAVGYDAQGSDKYWIVKNSWGLSWGNKGYIWMSRDKNNQCGIATKSSYPTV